MASPQSGRLASTHSLKDKINANSARIQELKDILVEKPEVPPLLHPNMGLHYRKEISKLMGLLDDPENRLEAIVLIRALIEKIVLNPIEGTKELAVDLHGDLAGVLKMASNKDKPLIEIETMADQVKMVAGGRLALIVGDDGKMVAGAGFEPAAFRL
jgi:site-specific DNA recombinase